MDPPYDELTELWVRDQKAVRELYRLSPEPVAHAAIKADEPGFQDLESKIVLICEESETDLSNYR